MRLDKNIPGRYNMLMKIGNIETTSNIFLAPMAGVTDFAFRSVAKDFGAGLTYTEMISAKGLVLSKNQKIYEEMLKTLPNEKPCAVQIFGSDPVFFAKACQHPLVQKFDTIDINMGCPAPKVIKNGDGSALLLNPDLAEEIAKACVAATDKPITVKMRAGFFKNDFVAADLAKRLEKVGVKAITIHGRTRQEMYSGKANLDVIKAVKNAVKIPVIGNGDVVCKQSLKAMLETGVDGVMIGRGAMGAPWIFQELLTDKPVSNQQKIDAINKHIGLLQEFYSEKYLSVYLRKHFLWYAKGQKNVSVKKVELARMQNVQDGQKTLRELFENAQN